MTTAASPRAVGVWQTAFLGDAVLTLPLVRSLAAAYPQARIHFFVRKGFGRLFAPSPLFASVREVDKRGALRSLTSSLAYGRELGREGFDLWVSCHNSLRSALIGRAVHAPVSVGYDAPLWNRLAYRHVVPRRFTERDEIERLLALLEPLHVPVASDWPELSLDPAARAEADAFFAARTAPVVGLHPGSVWPTKRWPPEYFAALLDLIVEAGYEAALFAGPGEEKTATEVLTRARHGRSEKVADLSGKLSLPGLAAHLAGLAAYVSNDSGPMHIAWALRTPVVAMFGPTVRHHGFFPRGAASTVLETGLSCRPCGLHGGKRCKLGHHRCMRDIRPEDAFAALTHVLEARRG